MALLVPFLRAQLVSRNCGFQNLTSECLVSMFLIQKQRKSQREGNVSQDRRNRFCPRDELSLFCVAKRLSPPLQARKSINPHRVLSLSRTEGLTTACTLAINFWSVECWSVDC